MTLPDGWRPGRLGELCSIEIGGTPSRAVEAYWDSAHETSNVWVSIRDMHQRSITGSTEQISDLGIKKSNVKLQQPGTVLLSFKLSIGRVAIAAVPLFTNEAIAGLSPTGLTRDFLFHGLQGWDLLQGVDQAIKGATLNKRKLKKILFEYPESEREQAKIAEVLSTVDRAIEQSEALIAKLQRIKTGLMQDLLTGNRRVTALLEQGKGATACSPSSQLPEGIGVPGMTLPDGWKQGLLGELCSIEIGGTPSRAVEAYWDSAHDTSNVWVSIRDMHQRSITGSTEQISDLGIKKSNVKLQQPGTVLLSFKLSIGRVAIAAVPLFTNEAIAGLSPNGLMRDFLFHGLRGWDLLQGVDQAIKGATLNKRKLKKIRFEYPESEREQAKIAEVLSTVDRAIEQSEALIAKLQCIKTGLMQDLLTGNRRVTALLEQGKGATP